jgi:hypothetical protein
MPETIFDLQSYFMHRARYTARRALASGKIEREPCACGREGQMHHRDYSDPLNVEWVCRSCLTARERAGLFRQPSWMTSVEAVDKLITRYGAASKSMTPTRVRVVGLLRDMRVRILNHQSATWKTTGYPRTPVQSATPERSADNGKKNAQVTENRRAITAITAMRKLNNRQRKLSNDEIELAVRLELEDKAGSATWGNGIQSRLDDERI